MEIPLSVSGKMHRRTTVIIIAAIQLFALPGIPSGGWFCLESMRFCSGPADRQQPTCGADGASCGESKPGLGHVARSVEIPERHDAKRCCFTAGSRGIPAQNQVNAQKTIPAVQEANRPIRILHAAGFSRKDTATAGAGPRPPPLGLEERLRWLQVSRT